MPHPASGAPVVAHANDVVAIYGLRRQLLADALRLLPQQRDLLALGRQVGLALCDLFRKRPFVLRQSVDKLLKLCDVAEEILPPLQRGRLGRRLALQRFQLCLKLRIGLPPRHRVSATFPTPLGWS